MAESNEAGPICFNNIQAELAANKPCHCTKSQLIAGPNRSGIRVDCYQSHLLPTSHELFYMNTYQIVLCAILSLGVLGTGALLDYRNADRDRAARTTDYSNPNTLLTGRTKPRSEDVKEKV